MSGKTIQGILRLSAPSQNALVNSDDFIQEILECSKFPKLTENEINSIINSIDAGKTLHDSLLASKFKFILIPENLKKSSQFVAKTRRESSIVAMFIFFSFLEWSRSGEDLSILSILLKSLNYLFNGEFGELAIKLYNEAFISYLELPDMTFFSEVFNTFINSADLNPESSELLLLVIKSFKEHRELVLSQKNICQVLSYMQLLINEKNKTIDENMENDLLDILLPFLESMDPTILPYFSIFQRSDTRERIATIIGNFISDYVFNSKFSVGLELPRAQVVIYTQQLKANVFRLPKDNTFTRFDLEYYDKIPERNEKRILVEEDLVMKLTIVLKTYDYSQPFIIAIITELSKSIEKSTKRNKFVELYCVLVYLISFVNSPVFLYKQLLTTSIFNSNLICSASDPHSFVMNDVRSFAFTALLKQGAEASEIMLNIMIPYPKLFAETIQRWLPYIDEISNFILNSDNLIETLTHGLLFMREQRYDGHGELNQAATAIYNMLTLLFERKEVFLKLFSDEFFSAFFVSSVFEKALQEFTEKMLIRALDSFDAIPISLVKAFNSALKFSLDNNLESIILLKTFCCFARKGKDFGICHENIRKILEISKTNTYYKEIFTYYKEMDTFDKVDLETAKKSFEKSDEPVNEEIISILMDFAARKKVGDFKFIIERGNPLSLIFFILKQQRRYKEITSNVSTLIAYSQENGSVLHEFGVSSYILDIIDEFWKGEEKIESTLFEAFFKIESIQASTKTVLRFIHFLDFIDKDKLSPHITEALDSLDFYFKTLHSKPLLSFPLTKGKHISYESPLITSFTFVCFLFLNDSAPKYFPSIISAQDEENHKLIISLIQKNIHVLDDMYKPTHVHGIQTQLEKSRWNFVALTYKVDNDTPYLTATINDTTHDPIQLTATELFTNTISFKFGGTLDSSVEPTKFRFNPAKISLFGLFPELTKQEIESAYHLGPNAIPNIKKEPFYICNSLHNSSDDTPFITVIVKHCRPTILLPLLQITKEESIITRVFQLLIDLLKIGVEIESVFLDDDVFLLLLYMFQRPDHPKVKLHYFKTMMKIFDAITSETLKQRFVTLILMNTSFWSDLTEDENKQLSQYICDENRRRDNAFASYTSISYELGQIFKNSISSEAPSSINSFIEATHRLIMQQTKDFVVDISQKEFSFSDYYFITSSIISTNTEVANNILDVLNSIIDTASDKLKELSQSSPFEFVAPFHYFLHHINPDICCYSFRIILRFFKTVITHPTLEKYLSIMLGQIPSRNITTEMLKVSIDEMNEGNHAILPIACHMAKTIGAQGLSLLVPELRPSQEYCKRSFWSFSPLSLFSISSQKQKSRIMTFITKCSEEQWLNVYAMIEILAAHKLLNEYEAKVAFFNSMASHIDSLDPQEVSEKTLTLFYSIAKSLIFFGEGCRNRALAEMLLSLPYKTSYSNIGVVHAQSNPHPSTAKGKGKSKGVLAFEGIKPTYKTVQYGLRIDSSWKWCDLEIVRRLLNIIINHKQSTNAIYLALLIIYYLLHIDPEEACTALTKINVNKENREELSIPIDLVSFTLNVLVLSSPILVYSSSRYPDDYIEEFKHILTLPVFETSSRIANDITRFSHSCNKISTDILKKVSQFDINRWKKFSEDISKEQAEELKKTEKTWNVILHNISISDFPWKTKHEERITSTFCRGPFIGMLTTFPKSNPTTRSTEEKEILSLQCKTIIGITTGFGGIHFYQDTFAIVTEEADFSLPYNDVIMLSGKENWVCGITKYKKFFKCSFKTSEEKEQSINEFSQHVSKFNSKFVKIPLINQANTATWMSNQLSNFKYLLFINTVAGRTFGINDSHFILPLVMTSKKPRSFKVRLGTPTASDVSLVYSNFINQGNTKHLTKCSDLFAKELPVECFCFPELFSKVELPLWAATEYDFVYKQRKMLESDLVSQHLNEWIDYNFPHLFEGPHPKRNPYPFVPHFKKSIEIPSKDIIFSFINDGPLFSIVSLSESGNYTNTSLFIDSSANELLINESFTRHIPSFEEHKGKEFQALANNSLAIVGKETLIFDGLSITKLSSRPTIAFHNHWCQCFINESIKVFANTRMTKLLYDRSILIDEPICATVSSQFSSIAICTRDRSVTVLDLFTGKPRFAFKLQSIASFVVITKSWGFIVCAREVKNGTVINVFTISGRQIRESFIAFRITTMATFESCDGFDFIVAGDDSGRVFVFEAFDLSIGEPHSTYNSEISSVGYCQSARSLVVVTKNGHVFVESCDPR